MAGKASSATDRGAAGARKLQHRPLPFVGLLLMVPVSAAPGVALHHVLRDNPVGTALTTGGLVGLTALLALAAYEIGARRRPVVRWHVVLTLLLAGAATALTVPIGYPEWWVVTYLICGVVVAISWMLYRIDALRHDPKDGEEEGDGLTRKLGLEDIRFGRPKHVRDERGEVTRIEIPATHLRGATVDALQDALPALESLANAPRRRSRATPDEGAQTSKLTIITKDVLRDPIPWPGPSAPGACITEPLVSGVYEDQQLVKRYVAGGRPEAPNPSSYGKMGMTRTGKTLNAQIEAMEIVTRRRVVMFWFDSIKGAQTVAPLRDCFDILVADDVESGDPRQFKAGMKALMNLIKWRANALGACGYRSWTPAAFDDPRLRMPLVIAHFEEADILCDIAPEEMVFLASKGLSAGIVSGYSLQRADAVSMPTGLRFNIGTWDCFGCGDAVSVGFALSDTTINAGAHPENWKQSKPGYFYREGIGIPEDRWAVTAKGFSVEDGEMDQHSRLWGPRMDPLDDGSVAALGEWYTRTKEIMARDAGDAGSRGTALVVPVPTAKPSPNGHRPAPAGADDEDDEDDPRAARRRAEEEIAQMRESGEIETDPDAVDIDPTVPVPPPASDEIEVTWTSRAAAPTAEAAAEAFDLALRDLAGTDDPKLRDPADPEAVLFGPGDLLERYPFRSRPWFSERLSSVIEGRVVVPPGLHVERTGDPKVPYRLTCQRERQSADT